MDDLETLSFEAFWSWLAGHPNCILRAGTPEAVIYDDEDYHWDFVEESPEIRLAQLIRGKRLVGELVVEPEKVTYVQGTSGDREGEWIFELVSETEKDRIALYFFVLTHGYDETESGTSRRIH